MHSNLKKAAAVASGLIVGLSLAACTGTAASTPVAEPTAAATATATPPPAASDASTTGPATPGPATPDPATTVNGFDARAVYAACYAAVPDDDWGSGSKPAADPFDPSYVFTAPSDPALTAVNVHLAGDQEGIDLIALCYVSGDASAPTVEFSKIAD